MTGNKYQTIKLEVDQSVAHLVLNRPEIHNAFNETMIREIGEALQGLASDEQVRVVLFRGEGKSFCAGADLNWMKKMAAYSAEENRDDAMKLFEMLQCIEQFPKPVLAQVHGAALGGGSGLVAAVDMAFATEDTKFAFSEVKLGLIPAVISPWVLQKIGPAKAREYFLTGERFSAKAAERMGLVNAVGSPDEIETLIQSKIKHLLAGGPEAQKESKRLIRDVAAAAPKDLAKLTGSRIAERRASTEGQEGMNAFLEKRLPQWNGPKS